MDPHGKESLPCSQLHQGLSSSHLIWKVGVRGMCDYLTDQGLVLRTTHERLHGTHLLLGMSDRRCPI